MSRRHELSDSQWGRLRPLLPPPAATDWSRKDDRTVLNGIPWSDLPERYGPCVTVPSRFRRWRQAGVWEWVPTALQVAGDTRGDLDWTLHFVDGTVDRAHQHAAGAKKGGGDQAMGRSRGAFSTKVHLRSERGGKQMVGVLTASKRHEQVDLPALLDAGAVKRLGHGRPGTRGTAAGRRGGSGGDEGSGR